MLFKNRGKKTEPALGAANENAVAAVNENEIATGENNFDSSSVAAQSRRQKAFRIFSIITCTLCGLLWAAFFISSFFVDLLVIQLRPLFFAGTFFTVLSVVAAVKIQPAKQGLSIPFYVISCLSLLLISLFYISSVMILYWWYLVACVLEIITAILGRKEKKKPFSGKMFLRLIAGLLAASVLVFSGEALLYRQRTTELSKATLNGVSLTKEEWACIDEEYVLRCGLQGRLNRVSISWLGYEEAWSQPDTMQGVLYHQKEAYMDDMKLQAEYVTISVVDGQIGMYSVSFAPVKPTNQDLKNLLDVYARVIGDDYSYGDKTYTAKEVLALASPAYAKQSFRNTITTVDKGVAGIVLDIKENGDVSAIVTIMFRITFKPEASKPVNIA